MDVPALMRIVGDLVVTAVLNMLAVFLLAWGLVALLMWVLDRP